MPPMSLPSSFAYDAAATVSLPLALTLTLTLTLTLDLTLTLTLSRVPGRCAPAEALLVPSAGLAGARGAADGAAGVT